MPRVLTRNMLHCILQGGDLYEELRRNGGRLKEEEVAMLVSTLIIPLSYCGTDLVILFKLILPDIKY